jgi:hypothetical protein
MPKKKRQKDKQQKDQKCPSFGHYVVCPSVLLLVIMLFVFLSFFFWSLCCLSFCPYFGHYVVCSFGHNVVCLFVLLLLVIMLFVLLSFFFWSLCCLSFYPSSFGHYEVHHRSLSWLATCDSINNGEVKLFVWTDSIQRFCVL